ncbi:hypothetical protein H0H93_012477, partial [Arthromyces matolae]
NPHRHLYNDDAFSDHIAHNGGGGIDGQSILTPSQDQAHKTHNWDPINLELHEVDKMEVPWNEKRDKVYWRGATTGGGNHPAGFSPQYQRHRFVRMASSNSTSAHPLTFAHPPSSPSASHYITTTIPQQSLNTEIMDTAFVKVVAAESYPGGLKALKDDHRFSSAVPLGVHWKYKYLLDIDGMGYSARFMAFLASDSVPVKMTVYEEFFSDWIEPWVHFIPLSSSYAEIYNIYAYFSGPPPSALNAVNSSLATLPTNSKERKSVEGDRKLKRIARAGKEWKKTVGRELDMEDSPWSGLDFGPMIGMRWDLNFELPFQSFLIVAPSSSSVAPTSRPTYV